ncbi:heat shock factor binding protein 1-domain-containing protein [Xylariales sp. PMI_506]|nr:heat shock factor binding protein 1-domain-containing protein [Xylariales sp. PMI_506]
MSSQKPDNVVSDKKETGNASDELNVVVEELLNSLSNKFASVSSEIFAKMDEMSRRLDNLEATLQNNQQNNTSSSSK